MSETVTFTLPVAAVEWLRKRERGSSSNAIFEKLTGLPCGSQLLSHPYDPDDLRRCRLLLAAVPQFRHDLEKMAEVGPEWAELVAIWDLLCITMEVEIAAFGDRCPETYRLMREAIERGRKKRTTPEPGFTIELRRPR
jgi:hypothetical protein